MPMHYADMCDELRSLMIDEIEIDGGAIYHSAYFTEAGAAAWKELLQAACQSGDDASLASQLGATHLKTHHSYLRQGRPVNARVPETAAKTIAESNFSRFYLRALCRMALAKGISTVVGYRAMDVERPRPGSQEKIGVAFDAETVLVDLRATMNGEPQHGMPPGVGSGILARLPN